MTTTNADSPVKTVTVAQNLCIDQAAALHDTLLDLVGSSEPAVVDLGSVDRCDVSGVQLLCALMGSARNRRQAVSFQNIPQAVFQAFDHAGIDAGQVLDVEQEA